MDRLELQEAALIRKRRELTELTADVEKRAGALRLAKAQAADVKDRHEVPAVPVGTVVAKVWPRGVQLADEVRLRGVIYEETPQREASGACYEYVHLTGDPEQDRWRGGCHDHTGPTFLRAAAAKRWNILARALNRLVERERVRITTKCRCKQ